MTFAPELTYILKKYPHEFTSKKEAEIVASKFNKVLTKINLGFMAKCDPFHFPYEKNSTYCIEVVPCTHIDCSYLSYDSELYDGYLKDYKKIFIRDISKIFKEAKKLGLVPRLETKDKKGNIKIWPCGGQHVHTSSDLYYCNSDFYDSMKKFHINLLTILANNPHIRWLFSGFDDNVNSKVLINEEMIIKDPNWFKSLNPDKLFSLYFYNNSITPRFAQLTKRSYLTWEHRYFGMTANAEEVFLTCNFVRVLMEKIRSDTSLNIEYELSLNLDSFKVFKDLKLAKEHFKSFFEKWLGLSWKKYEIFFDRNYVNRVKYGSLI